MIKFKGNNFVNKDLKILSLEKIDKIVPAEKINAFIKTIKARAAFEMPQTGTFRTITEELKDIKSALQIGDVSVNLRATSTLNTSTERILDVVVSSKSGEYFLTQDLVQGKTEDILKFVNDEKFAENFKRFLIDCSNNFERKGLQ